MIKRMLSHALTTCLLILFVLLFCLVARAARPPFEIDEFIDGRDGTATLKVICDNGVWVAITFKRKDLDKVQIEKLYDQIEELCRDAKNK